MTRSKSKPPIHKPAFDVEGALRFAAEGADPVAVDVPAGLLGQEAASASGTNRLPLTLMLKPEVIARLKEEAGRKEKTIDQVVEKLVAKHLGKH